MKNTKNYNLQIREVLTGFKNIGEQMKFADIKKDAKYVFGSDNIPKCSCGGIIKPDVVLYEEGLDESTLYGSIHHIQNADLMIVAGTSLTVQPASSLINYFRGKHLVLINKDKTMYDNKADLVINEALGNVFKEV